MKKILLFILLILTSISFAQNFTSYFTGNNQDAKIISSGGICLMGGATEDDNSMRWFLNRANGGDILVLRASGSDGYNNYMYSELGIKVNSVETIVFHDRQASYDDYVINKINNAEAIWFAGGDQWKYISYWRSTPVDSAINKAITERNIVIGGTSAGMAILGDFYFTAQNGTISSAQALANPFSNSLTIADASFIKNKFLKNTLTDTHFDNPDRKGRVIAFLARIFTDYGVFANAIACDEYTAVCIDTNGIARVFGNYPKYDDNAYFIQSNCELIDRSPENCSLGSPLTWFRQEQALKVYQVKGDSLGSNMFNLHTWQSGSGGTWYDWSVQEGVFQENQGLPINCSPNSLDYSLYDEKIKVFPNPTYDILNISVDLNNLQNLNFLLFDQLGQLSYCNYERKNNLIILNLSSLNKGIYYLVLLNKTNIVYRQIILKL